MASVATRPASEIDFETLVHAFNTGYRDYAVPVNVNATQLRHHIEQNDINLNVSPVALSAGEVVGIGLLAVRQNRGWIGGLGVSPDHRRQGIGRMLMAAAIDSARQLDLKTVQLEVIDGNEAAHRLYLDLGFADTRHLLILERAAAALTERETGVQVPSAEGSEILPHMGSFHARPNPWQRDPVSLEKLTHSLNAWKVTDGDAILAYVMGQISESSIQLWDMAFATDCDDALRAIIVHLHQQHPAAPGRFLNVADDDPVWPILQALGYQVTLSQHEMSLTL